LVPALNIKVVTCAPATRTVSVQAGIEVAFVIEPEHPLSELAGLPVEPDTKVSA
jgi:hypothetical protein